MIDPAKSKRLEEAQRAFDAATVVMEKTANRVIERIIRRGYVERDEVRKLRLGDATCRQLLEELDRAREAINGER